jgi:uncharacterized protein (DUF1499 family)
MTSLFAILSSVLLVLGLHFEGPVPGNLGVHAGSLSPCETSAHCARADWPVADPDAAFATLKALIAATPRTLIVEQRPGYLHATATSQLFGFVDDLELHASDGSLQARSVSRLGDSDLGVNRQRLQALHQALMSQAPAISPGPAG